MGQITVVIRLFIKAEDSFSLAVFALLYVFCTAVIQTSCFVNVNKQIITGIIKNV